MNTEKIASILAIRSVQLDLARQMETIAFIKDFTDFIAANGYNSLTLYLEGRIRTASFPYPAAEKSYSPDQIREIVGYATDQRIEVIPVISTLSHAALFLQHSALAFLAENRPPFSGRFPGDYRHVFCPSQPETYEFFRAYLGEITPLFPSAYFHAGCDEAWDIGLCDLCQKRLSRGETQADLFARHLEETHTILTGGLGKRMIIWDDMFENYPEALERLPRDVVLAHWQYQGNVGPSRAHFSNRRMENSPAKYRRLGFDFLVCPADYTLENAENLTAYAAPSRPLGGLLTTWGKERLTLLRSYPLIAAVGRIWRDGTPPQETLADFFGVEDAVFLRAVEALCRSGQYLEHRYRLKDYLACRENASDYARENLTALLLELLPTYLGKVSPLRRRILEDMLISLESEQVGFELDQLLPAFFGKRDADLEDRLGRIRHRLEGIREARLTLWHVIRPGLSSSRIENDFDTLLRELEEFSTFTAGHGALIVHFFLPDQYEAQTTRLSLRYADEEAHEKIAAGVFKETRDFDAFYSQIFPVAQDRIPDELLIETFGYGGQGFTWFEIRNACGRFIPEAICPVQGILRDADNLLAPDWQWAFSGERNVRAHYLEPHRAREVHAFRVKLKWKNLSDNWS